MISRAITPLRLIFWGGQICLLDLSISQVSPSGENGRGFRFDFINDFVGTVMIAVGVFQLGEFIVDRGYRFAMLFVKIVSLFVALHAIREHFIFPISPPLQIMEHVFGLVELAAIITFCEAMQRLSKAARLPVSSASWRTTKILFAVLFAVPLIIVHFLGFLSLTNEVKYHINLGAPGLLLLPLFVIPIVHLFISTSRMRREAGGTLV